MIKLFVGNIPYAFNDEDLKDWFVDLGFTPVKANVVTDRESGQSRGFGFVEFADRKEGEDAAYAANGRDCNKREIVCNEARPKEQAGRRWRKGTAQIINGVRVRGPGCRNAPGLFYLRGCS